MDSLWQDLRYATQIVGLFVGQGMRLTAIGIAIGLALALALARLLSAVFLGMAATDLLAILTVLAVLAGVAFLACWVPARRAANVDPMRALRLE